MRATGMFVDFTVKSGENGPEIGRHGRKRLPNREVLAAAAPRVVQVLAMLSPAKKRYPSLEKLLRDIRACNACHDLPLGPRPVLRVNPSARLLIVGQAPGTKVHNTGIPWNDRSGDTLRGWMDVDRDTFYDESRVAIIPVGLCYPGKGKMGDLPPRKECSELWLPHILPHLPNVELTLLVGIYAQRVYLGPRMKKNLTETVRAWREYGPEYIPTPHPSFHNLRWQQINPWFHQEVIPALRAAVRGILRD